MKSSSRLAICFPVLLAIAVALVPSQADADGVYYCSDTAWLGFAWKDGRYVTQTFSKRRFKVDLYPNDGNDNARVFNDGYVVIEDQSGKSHKNCTKDEHVWFCTDELGDSFNLNSDTGEYTRASTYGHLFQEDLIGADSLAVGYCTCSTF